MNEFTVYGKVQGKGRPRFGRGHAYTPQKTVDYEDLIRTSFLTSIRKKHLAEVGVKIEIYCKKLIMKPDIDNVCKIILDSLNGLAYDDDRQVVKIEAEKFASNEEKLIIKTYDIQNTKRDV